MLDKGTFETLLKLQKRFLTYFTIPMERKFESKDKMRDIQTLRKTNVEIDVWYRTVFLNLLGFESR